MKNLIFFFICVLIFASCNPIFIDQLPQKYPPNNERIVDIETKKHNRNITVYHINDKIERPHLKVSIIETYGTVENSYANLVLGLKEKARIEGVDAIVIYRQGLNERSEFTFEGYGSTFSTKEVVAYGIIYKENLDLTNRFPKTEVVYGYRSNENTFEKIATKKLNLKQRVMEVEGEDNLSKIVQPYTLNHLLKEVENWTFRERNNQVVQRTYRNEIGLVKTCDFKYDDTGRVESINIEVIQETVRNNYFGEQLVNLEYDEANRLSKKIIYPNIDNQNLHYEEIFTYENNQLKEKVLYSINNDVRGPIAKFIYLDYYTMKDLEDIFPELK